MKVLTIYKAKNGNTFSLHRTHKIKKIFSSRRRLHASVVAV